MGGNVSFDGVSADRIDLKEVDRADFVRSLSLGLGLINSAFQKKTGFPIWKYGIQEYLSGSTTTLFDLTIPTEKYKGIKPSVGDIDTQVDGNSEKQLQEFLKGAKGEKYGDLELVDSKTTPNTIVTLWRHTRYGLNIQIDLELVSFLNGKPTPWSRFIFSSPWADMELGIKGAAHKLIFRAITAIWNRNIRIQMKTEQKEVETSHLAFSSKGLRTKLEPIEGNLYREIPTTDSTYVTSLPDIFKTLFGTTASKSDLEKMHSYIGVIDLCKRYLKKSDLTTVAYGMANLLFGSGSGGRLMYVHDHERDRAEKLVMLHYMCEKFGINPNVFDKLVEGYYKRMGK